MAVGFALLGVVAIAFIGLVLAAITLWSLVLTVVAIRAWNKPVRFMREVIQPWEARAFVLSGVGGAVLIPVLVSMFTRGTNAEIPANYQWLVVLAGYGVGSTICALITNQMDGAEPAATIEPEQEVLPPPPKPEKEFEFASWDDEDERR